MLPVLICLWGLIKHGVPQCSFFHPIPLNVFLCDTSVLTKTVDTASYVDDNTIYTIGNNQDEVKKRSRVGKTS